MRKVFSTLPPFPWHTGLSELSTSPLDTPQWQKMNPPKRLKGVEEQGSSYTFSNEPRSKEEWSLDRQQCQDFGPSMPVFSLFYWPQSHIKYWAGGNTMLCFSFQTAASEAFLCSFRGHKQYLDQVLLHNIASCMQEACCCSHLGESTVRTLQQYNCHASGSSSSIFTHTAFHPWVFTSRIRMSTVCSGTLTCCDISRSSLLTGRFSWGASCKGWEDSVCLVNATDTEN